MSTYNLKVLRSRWERCTQCSYGEYKFDRPHWRYSIIDEAGNEHRGTESTFPRSFFKLVLFLGEAPGQSEIDVGEPFVGRSGKLLQEMIDKAREHHTFSYFICNSVLCAPVVEVAGGEPLLHTPYDPCIEACSQRVQEIIQTIKPDLIVALGNVPHKSLKHLKVDHLHLKHPAYLLRQGGIKSVNYKRTYLTLVNTIGNVKTKATT